METGSYTNRFPSNNHRRVQKNSAFTTDFPFFPKSSIPRVQSTNSAGSQSHACTLRLKGDKHYPKLQRNKNPQDAAELFHVLDTGQR